MTTKLNTAALALTPVAARPESDYRACISPERDLACVTITRSHAGALEIVTASTDNTVLSCSPVPAAAGLRSGDRIIAADGVPLGDMLLSQGLDSILEPKASHTFLVMRRAYAEEACFGAFQKWAATAKLVVNRNHSSKVRFIACRVELNRTRHSLGYALAKWLVWRRREQRFRIDDLITAEAAIRLRVALHAWARRQSTESARAACAESWWHNAARRHALRLLEAHAHTQLSASARSIRAVRSALSVALWRMRSATAWIRAYESATARATQLVWRRRARAALASLRAATSRHAGGGAWPHPAAIAAAYAVRHWLSELRDAWDRWVSCVTHVRLPVGHAIGTAIAHAWSRWAVWWTYAARCTAIAHASALSGRGCVLRAAWASLASSTSEATRVGAFTAVVACRHHLAAKSFGWMRWTLLHAEGKRISTLGALFLVWRCQVYAQRAWDRWADRTVHGHVTRLHALRRYLSTLARAHAQWVGVLDESRHRYEETIESHRRHRDRELQRAAMVNLSRTRSAQAQLLYAAEVCAQRIRLHALLVWCRGARRAMQAMAVHERRVLSRLRSSWATWQTAVSHAHVLQIRNALRSLGYTRAALRRWSTAVAMHFSTSENMHIAMVFGETRARRAAVHRGWDTWRRLVTDRQQPVLRRLVALWRVRADVGRAARMAEQLRQLTATRTARAQLHWHATVTTAALRIWATRKAERARALAAHTTAADGADEHAARVALRRLFAYSEHLQVMQGAFRRLMMRAAVEGDLLEASVRAFQHAAALRALRRVCACLRERVAERSHESIARVRIRKMRLDQAVQEWTVRTYRLHLIANAPSTHRFFACGRAWRAWRQRRAARREWIDRRDAVWKPAYRRHQQRLFVARAYEWWVRYYTTVAAAHGRARQRREMLERLGWMRDQCAHAGIGRAMTAVAHATDWMGGARRGFAAFACIVPMAHQAAAHARRRALRFAVRSLTERADAAWVAFSRRDEDACCANRGRIRRGLQALRRRVIDVRHMIALTARSRERGRHATLHNAFSVRWLLLWHVHIFDGRLHEVISARYARRRALHNAFCLLAPLLMALKARHIEEVAIYRRVALRRLFRYFRRPLARRSTLRRLMWMVRTWRGVRALESHADGCSRACTLLSIAATRAPSLLMRAAIARLRKWTRLRTACTSRHTLAASHHTGSVALSRTLMHWQLHVLVAFELNAALRVVSNRHTGGLARRGFSWLKEHASFAWRISSMRAHRRHRTLRRAVEEWRRWRDECACMHIHTGPAKGEVASRNALRRWLEAAAISRELDAATMVRTRLHDARIRADGLRRWQWAARAWAHQRGVHDRGERVWRMGTLTLCVRRWRASAAGLGAARWYSERAISEAWDVWLASTVRCLRATWQHDAAVRCCKSQGLQRGCVALARQSVRAAQCDLRCLRADERRLVLATRAWAAHALFSRPRERRARLQTAHSLAERYWRLRTLFGGFAKLVAAAALF